jgi:hypothetical protein
LSKIESEFREIDISYSGFGLFKLNVLYLNPDMNIKLIELYNYVKEKSFEKDDDLAAHTTILMDEPEKVIKVLLKIAESFEKINGKLKFVSLYEFFPKRLIKRIELKA